MEDPLTPDPPAVEIGGQAADVACSASEDDCGLRGTYLRVLLSRFGFRSAIGHDGAELGVEAVM
ncbi:hypothetical protein [Nocardia sp. NPDC059239]|uniref:hypothetical protein n=1 Tax=Nocardia sp. NPDC059239 TaxID=3346785 RepID=UPI0036AAD7AE